MSLSIERGLLLATPFMAACHLVHHRAEQPAPDPIDPGDTGDAVSENTVARGPVHLDAIHNPFFRDNGTNSRTCGTCHHEDQGWTMTPDFARSQSADEPLFLFDGSDCLPAGTPNRLPVENSTEMRNFGNVRIELPILPGADYTLEAFTDPHDCPVPPSEKALRMYRRPPPVANTAFAAAVMWDGRETTPSFVFDDLKRQAETANRVHAQADNALGDSDREDIVAFETRLFHARRRIGSLDLARNGGNGGPAFLRDSVEPGFVVGVNSPFADGFDPRIFTLYAAWEPGSGSIAPTPLAESIGRGEVVFNTKSITIDGVGGLNGPSDPTLASIRGSCGTCHNNPEVGNLSLPDFLDIGVTPAAARGLDVGHLPSYRFRETASGRTVVLTDPGRGLVTGKFADLGKTKVPNLRGLTTRAPYFHNGSARDLSTVVDFYERRFRINFTAQEKTDLVAFLAAL